MVWNAKTVMDTDLNNTQDGGGLAVDLHGNPVSYSNGGYMVEVRPEFGGPGIFEITHWYTDAPSGPTMGPVKGSYRIPVATDDTILDARVAVTLPATATSVSFDPVSSNAAMPRWGTPYSNYTWARQASLASSDDATRTYVVDLGTLAAHTGTVFQLDFTVPIGTDLADPVYTTARLSGAAEQGSGACAVTRPPAPTVTTQTCKLALAGQTVFPLPSPDITVRDKWDDYGAIHLTIDPTTSADDLWRTTPTPEGEVNADGWGAPPQRFMRFYAATNKGVGDATYTVTAVQGMRFTTPPDTLYTGTPTGMGQLYGNGFTIPVTGAGTATVSADGTTITLHIDSMPAKSGFAFVVPVTADSSGKAFVANETLAASVMGCTDTAGGGPTPTTTPTATPTVTPTVTPTGTVAPSIHGPSVDTGGHVIAEPASSDSSRPGSLAIVGCALALLALGGLARLLAHHAS
ncbi:hypothetical protein GCM10027053_27030 [Intrasporangium mesophilum]